jgi:hypothetical protein
MNNSGNTAVGGAALYNTTGDANTAIGLNTLFHNTTGTGNTAVGNIALFGNTTGSNNIALGFGAGFNVTESDNNIFIGNPGPAGPVAGAIFIGDPSIQGFTVIAGIFGATTAGGIPVYIDSNHRLGTATSSQRFKEAIKPMASSSETLYALKPITFRYKKEIDPTGITQFGLVAEDVLNVNPDLVARDKEGKPYSVRYDQVNAMLLNEFLKEHKTVEQLQATVAELKATVAQQEKALQSKACEQQKQIDALASDLQQMDAVIHLQKPAAGAVAKY